jgi:hypothetical protein
VYLAVAVEVERQLHNQLQTVIIKHQEILQVLFIILHMLMEGQVVKQEAAD